MGRESSVERKDFAKLSSVIALETACETQDN